MQLTVNGFQMQRGKGSEAPGGRLKGEGRSYALVRHWSKLSEPKVVLQGRVGAELAVDSGSCNLNKQSQDHLGLSRWR